MSTKIFLMITESNFKLRLHGKVQPISLHNSTLWRSNRLTGTVPACTDPATKFSQSLLKLLLARRPHLGTPRT